MGLRLFLTAIMRNVLKLKPKKRKADYQIYLKDSETHNQSIIKRYGVPGWAQLPGNQNNIYIEGIKLA